MVLRFPPLAVVLFALPLDGPKPATLVERPGESMHIARQETREAGEFLTTVRFPFHSGCSFPGFPADRGADPSGEVDWNTGPGDPCITIHVRRDGQPVLDGTVMLQYCEAKGAATGPRAGSECSAGGGGGTWVTRGRMSLDEANGGVVTFGGPYALSRDQVQGFRWRYAAQGSGTSSYRSGSFNVGPGVVR